MDIHKRALYNSLRMNWLIDPALEVDSWQVENYRDMSQPLIFNRLRQHGYDFDKSTFLKLSEEYDTPEELTESLVDDEVAPEKEDAIYLLIFELWRRFETGKPCLSVFCDELDHQIFLYDHNKAQDVEDIQDVLSNLQVILEENVDCGAEPVDVLNSINEGCANDIETFLYDFITEQVDNENFSYALELLDAFIDYVEDDKWFEFLRVRIYLHSDVESAITLIDQLIDEAFHHDDLQFNLELLSEMVQEGGVASFAALVYRSVDLLETEEDFQDLLGVSLDFFSCQDCEREENIVLAILKKREEREVSAPFKNNDGDLAKLLALFPHKRPSPSKSSLLN